ncbi:hypothetical protein ACQQ2N_04510 [Dokdonella sp. MW10]|uniref:hypothetical protein n=1 Tax=Dokdonella sp. MW10 TaxID=2992926 RepID=UPI003F7D9696
MSHLDDEDLATKLERIMLRRPASVELKPLKDRVLWAMCALDGEDIYIEPHHVRWLTGQRGTLGEIKQLIRECCAERRLRKGTSLISSPAYDEAFAVLLDHARAAIEAEFNDRNDQLLQDARALVVAQDELEKAIQVHEDREKAAEDLKTALAKELRDGRDERTRLQAHVTEKDIQLASLATELSDAQEQLMASRDELATERSRLAEASEEIHRVETELAIRDAAIARATSSIDEQSALIRGLRSANTRLDGDLRASTKSLDVASKRERQQEKERIRLESSLSQANAKLARERSQSASYRDQLKAAQQQTTGSQRDVRNLTRELAISQKSREADAEALQVARVRSEELRRDLRQTRVDLLRATRSLQQRPGQR